MEMTVTIWRTNVDNIKWLFVITLLCLTKVCHGQPQLFSNNCEQITSNGVKEYFICAEDPISLTSARYRYNLTVDPESYTCGATSQQYCTLELPPVCDLCDQSQPDKSHDPELMVDMKNNQSNTDTWWQSITWAMTWRKPLSVNITLSFDHVYELQNVIKIRFKSGRPQKMTLLKSVDFGQTWTPLQYYQKNCDDRYAAGVPDNVTASDPKAVICTSRYSEDAPYVNGVVEFDVTNDRFRLYLGDNLANYAALYQVFNSTNLGEFLSFTDLRLQLVEPSTAGKSERDPVSLISFYYAISSITIQASCSQQLNGGTKCNCEHNTDGDNCERCLPLYNNKPWKPGFYTPYPRGTANPCEKCECYDHAESCTYSSEFNIGVCDDCMHNTTGVRCEKCREGFFPNSSLPLNDINRCTACDCEPIGVVAGMMGCEPTTGQCACKSDDIEGRRCDLCKDGKYGLLLNGTCLDCTCDPYGTMGFNTACDKTTGQCLCKPNVGQRACDQCKDGYYSFPKGRMTGDCIDCQCDPGGSVNLVCDKVTGQCPCRSGISGLRCDQPIIGTYSPDLDYFRVQPRGGMCSLDTDLLTADNLFTGRIFSLCQGSDTVSFQETDGTHKQPQVVWSYLPALRYSLNSSKPWPSVSLTITILGNSGIDVTGFQFAAPEETIASNCNPDGLLSTLKTISMTNLNPVSDPDRINDTLLIDSIVFVPDHNKSTAFIEAESDLRRDQLVCEQRLIALSSRQAALEDPVCAKFAYATTLQMASGALPCQCDSLGTIPGTTCEANGGQCHCKPGVYGRQCDICAPGFYNKTIQGCTRDPLFFPPEETTEAGSVNYGLVAVITVMIVIIVVIALVLCFVRRYRKAVVKCLSGKKPTVAYIDTQGISSDSKAPIVDKDSRPVGYGSDLRLEHGERTKMVNGKLVFDARLDVPDLIRREADLEEESERYHAGPVGGMKTRLLPETNDHKTKSANGRRRKEVLDVKNPVFDDELESGGVRQTGPDQSSDVVNAFYDKLKKISDNIGVDGNQKNRNDEETDRKNNDTNKNGKLGKTPLDKTRIGDNKLSTENQQPPSRTTEIIEPKGESEKGGEINPGPVSDDDSAPQIKTNHPAMAPVSGPRHDRRLPNTTLATTGRTLTNPSCDPNAKREASTRPRLSRDDKASLIERKSLFSRSSTDHDGGHSGGGAPKADNSITGSRPRNKLSKTDSTISGYKPRPKPRKVNQRGPDTPVRSSQHDPRTKPRLRADGPRKKKISEHDKQKESDKQRHPRPLRITDGRSSKLDPDKVAIVDPDQFGNDDDFDSSLNGSRNLVCDYNNGQCPCRTNVATYSEQNVLGIDNDLQCRSCIVNYYGHGTGNGCLPCGCDVRGTNSSQCNDTGQCECKPTVGGAKCDVCQDGYYQFTPDGCSLCNCSEAGSRGVQCDTNTGQCTCKQNVNGLKCDSCVVGSFNLDMSNPEGCQRCFCYTHGIECQSAPGYSARILLALETEIQTWTMIDPFGSSVTSHYSAPDRFLGNKLTSYGTNITFKARTRGGEFVDFSAENSVILKGNGELIKYNSTEAMPALSEPRQFNVSLRERYWFYDDITSPDYLQFYRLSCEKCAQGYKRPTVNASSYETCISCDCNQRTYTDPPVCDEDTGVCLNCKNGTNGTQCETCSAFVQDCTVCTDTQCGQCIDGYWGMDNDGCKPCECHSMGATSSSCDKVTGQCLCRPNVGERQCDQCIDNFFQMTISGCQGKHILYDARLGVECDSCYNLVKADVDQLRAIRDNVTQLISDLQASDDTAQLGPFGPRLIDTQSDMQWLLLYLSEAEAVQTDTLSEVNRLNTTLSQFHETLYDLDRKLATVNNNVTVGASNTTLGTNITDKIHVVMVEANMILNDKTGNTTRQIEQLLASIQKVQRAMAGVSNDAIGDVLRVSGMVNSIKSGSTNAKSVADKAYLTAQAAQNAHKQTTSGISTLEQFVLQINRLKEDTASEAVYVLGNASLRLNTANMALTNATNMTPIPTDVNSLVNKAAMLKNEGQGLKTQGDKATADAADTVSTVNAATVRTNDLLGQVNNINGQSGLLQMRLDSATLQVANAKLLANRSFEDAGKMLNIMQDFNNQVQAVEVQANEALEKVQEIQKLGEQSINDGRLLQDQLVTPLERTEVALTRATVASDISGINTGLFEDVYKSAQSLNNYSKSVLNNVSAYPSIVSRLNSTVVTPIDQTCTKSEQDINELQCRRSSACERDPSLGTFVSRICHSNKKAGYKMRSVELQSTPVKRDLGVFVDEALKFRDHVSYAVNKASRLLGLIRTAFSCIDEFTLPRLFMTLVRLHLEYGNIICHPRYRIDKIQIEKFRRERLS
ncbi:hypothetical protein LSH36_834g00055 [Paralvinella palmiformis]|uniref:Uncharacterized protein n=1 Tax=Paralvinella palmiformis TaxID=53620 RepID=A0AAD9MS85_9ANNE|nr:hypothetical protein LSH36_834g00055 [Paralvinella palmiformis]